MDLADDCLAELDVVVASVHSAFNQDEAQMTDRMLRAIANPFVDIIGHPTGRILLRRDPYKLDVSKLIDAAVEAGVALEINCQVDRLDLSDANAKAARDRGVTIVISTDSHATGGFRLMQWGVQVARRAWLTKEDVLNTRDVDEFRSRVTDETKSEERKTNNVTRVTQLKSFACDLYSFFAFRSSFSSSASGFSPALPSPIASARGRPCRPPLALALLRSTSSSAGRSPSQSPV